MNKVTLIGRVGIKNEMKTLDSGVEVITFTLATSETYKDKNGEKQQSTEWHSIKAFKSQASLIEKYVSKGDMLAIEGKIQYQKWEDKEGNKKEKTEILLSSVMLLTPKKDGNNSSAQQVAREENYEQYKKENQESAPKNNTEVDDLPF